MREPTKRLEAFGFFGKARPSSPLQKTMSTSPLQLHYCCADLYSVHSPQQKTSGDDNIRAPNSPTLFHTTAADVGSN